MVCFFILYAKTIGMKNDNDKQSPAYPVREGTEDSSILHGKHPPANNKYPQKEEKDKQVAGQPEFTEEQPNRKSPNSPQQ